MKSSRRSAWPASRWMGLWAAAVVAAPGLANAQPADLFYERTVMTAADARCDLFAPEVGAALAAATAQARGAALRAGASAEALRAVELSARAQPRHWHPTAGLRVGDRLALITDTAYDPGSAPFARGVDHLLHEAWGTEGDGSAAEAAQVAADAGARRLTLIHMAPDADEAALLAQAPGATIGRDGAAL